jgi:putative transposase
VRARGDPGKVVSPSSKSKAVEHVQTELDVSERRACRVVEQPRSTQRYPKKQSEYEKRLVERMHELVRASPRSGYRSIHLALVDEGWRVNTKRIHRLWKREGFRVPRRVVKKRRLGTSANGAVRYKALGRNHVWAWDFIHERTEDGRPIKCLSILDEYTRLSVALELRRQIGNEDVLEILQEATRRWGVPEHIRSDNGPEFIAQGLRKALSALGIGTLYIEPGAPWENGYAESFHARLRDELFNVESFTSLLEAQVITRDWQRHYNTRRPHSALGYQTPAAFAQSCGNAGLVDSLGETKNPFPPSCPQPLTNCAKSRAVAHSSTAATTI